MTKNVRYSEVSLSLFKYSSEYLNPLKQCITVVILKIFPIRYKPACIILYVSPMFYKLLCVRDSRT